VEANVPDLVEMSETDAIDTLRLLGAEVVTTDEFQATQATGTVLAQEPAAGEALPAIVHLSVAEAGIPRGGSGGKHCGAH
jgi:beta-lactam-binding protein with PASTA domain